MKFITRYFQIWEVKALYSEGDSPHRIEITGKYAAHTIHEAMEAAKISIEDIFPRDVERVAIIYCDLVAEQVKLLEPWKTGGQK